MSAEPSGRQGRAGRLLESLREWLRETLARTPEKSELAGAIGYVPMRWTVLTRYRDDGRIEIENNTAERALRAIALGRNYAKRPFMRSGRHGAGLQAG